MEEKITKFFANDEGNSKFSGSFQYSTAKNVGWVHIDSINCKWVGIVYLTPNAPVSCGTSFYRLKEYDAMHEDDEIRLNCADIRKKYCHDVTKWELVDNVGNVFNRLVIYDSRYYHRAKDYFGSDINDGRLIQVFFFDTEY